MLKKYYKKKTYYNGNDVNRIINRSPTRFSHYPPCPYPNKNNYTIVKYIN